MPYRRLPNTDAARIRALKAALKKSKSADDINSIAYSFALKQKIDIFLPKFETAITNSKSAREKQSDNSKNFSELTKKARLYISHFIQVLNFTIARGELKPHARTFYGLDENDAKVPSLLTEQELLNWGEKIITGEQERTKNREGNPIYSPNIALVKVNYENFKQSYEFQKRLQANSSRFSSDVAQFRQEADDMIISIWNEVEAYFANVKDEEQKRYMCEEYGLVYIFRRGEKERLRRLKDADEITLKLPF
ncbi:hypothetical protein LJB85_01760 [Porphyromonadaceae bacterium OttesenSCG-928-L07]|nr:hypothetical protein [Porphyromonadaceae bacterium OttesenSCG-928-L07]MDL2251528.1 hypothetical protein [Odoribacter sp. OttesenSCG-928-J03]